MTKEQYPYYLEHLKSDSNISKPELETLDYKPKQPTDPEYIRLTKDKPKQPKCKTCDDTGVIYETPKNPSYHKSCPDCQPEQPVGCPDLETTHLGIPNKTEQPNPNIMVFEQIDGCCDIINKLLSELKPQTESVWCCKVTHDIWCNNDLKRLKGAFE